MGNTIDQIAIGELLDGRYFYIPAYQRGYRWTEKQVGDLLRDLLTFANDDQKDDYAFYCLQPVIARPITDREHISELFGEAVVDNALEKGVWEIIDGQQRITTLYLIYRYLMLDKWHNDIAKASESLKLRNHKELYHILYATRKDSATFLNDLSLDLIDDEARLQECYTNIDFYHMAKAFCYIDRWVMTDGVDINRRFHLLEDVDTVNQTLFGLINGNRETKSGSIQVLWYELAEDSSQSSIKEFQKINTGKIKLTDAELIKGLFLMEKNFTSGKVHLSELALEWEFIENTLHDDSFWYFLQKRGSDMPNRIDFLFHLLYKTTKLKGIPETEWTKRLEQLDLLIEDTSRSEIFRFYYDKFEGRNGEDLNLAVTEAWQEVMTLFRTLDDWYCTPAIYNYIGLLSQFGVDLTRIILHFNLMDESSTDKDFVDYLIGEIRTCLKGIDVEPELKQITTKYKSTEHSNLYNLLLTLNVHLINKQNSRFDSSSDVYKFPFDVLNSQMWDIEHVDSFHSNKLSKDTQKIEWIDTALADLKGLSDEERESILNLKVNGQYESAIARIKTVANEVDDDNPEDVKNSIGNLVLLDHNTNRSYGNDLFCTKRRKIIEKMEDGVYIPTGTQYVFFKLFDVSGTNRSNWSPADIQAYHNFVFQELKDYLVEPKLKDEFKEEEDATDE